MIAVEPALGGVVVCYRRNGDEQRAEADAAVVAVPGSLVSSICPHLTPSERDFFAGVRYVRGIIVFLLFQQAPATLPYRMPLGAVEDVHIPKSQKHLAPDCVLHYEHRLRCS